MEKTEKIQELVVNLLKMMSLPEAEIKLRTEEGESGDIIYVDVFGKDLGILIGFRGKTLKSFQTVVSLMVANMFDDGTIALVDINEYWEARAATLRKMVDYFADKMREKHESEYDLQPMDARERKVIHEYAQKVPGMSTRSDGEGEERHVVLVME